MATRPLIGCVAYGKQANEDSSRIVYGLAASYTKAVLAAGGLPVLIPLGLSKNDLQELLSRLDGILLPGGGDVEPEEYGGDSADPKLRSVDTERDWVEILLTHDALQHQKPYLAICRGIQVFNVALGGTLWQDLADNMPDSITHDYDSSGKRTQLAHEITIEPDSVLAQALGTCSLVVNSFHHQGIRQLAPGLRAVATTSDGLIEAVEVADHPFAVGVQWHPENMLEVEPRMRRLFETFVQMASNGSR